MADDASLGIYSETPGTERVIRGLGVTLYVLVLNQISFSALTLIAPLVIALIISYPLVVAAQGAISGLVIVILFYIYQLIQSWVYLKVLQPILTQLFFGSPAFGKIGGDTTIRRKPFFTAMKCAAATTIQIANQDIAKANLFFEVDSEIFEDVLKIGYSKNAYHPSDAADDFETSWKNVWNNQILPLHTGDIALKDVLSADHYLSFALMINKLPRTGNAVELVIAVFQIVMVFLLSAFLNGSLTLLPVIQMGVFLCFIFSTIWYIFHSWQLSTYHALLEQELNILPEDLRAKYQDRVQAFGSPEIRIQKITVEKHYTAIIRDYMLTVILAETLANTLLILPVVGLAILIGYVTSAPVMPPLVLWYRDFVLGMILISLGFIGGYYLIFFILQYIRRIAAPIVVAVLGFILPYAIQYLLTGQIQPDVSASPALAVIGAAGVLISTSVTSQIRKVIEE